MSDREEVRYDMTWMEVDYNFCQISVFFVFLLRYQWVPIYYESYLLWLCIMFASDIHTDVVRDLSSIHDCKFDWNLFSLFIFLVLFLFWYWLLFFIYVHNE